MIWLGLIIGLVLGSNIGLFLYAIILSGKEADKRFYDSDITGGIEK